MVEKISVPLLHGIIAKMIKKKMNPSHTELSRKWPRNFIYKGIFDFAIIPYMLVGVFKFHYGVSPDLYSADCDFGRVCLDISEFSLYYTHLWSDLLQGICL